MRLSRRRALGGLLAAPLPASLARPAGAVIILDSTWQAEGGGPDRESAGFGAHVALGSQPQFAGVIALSDDDGETWGAASGTWIGNVGGRAQILTAAHVFEQGGSAEEYLYRTPGGIVRHGASIAFHPLYTWDNDARTGYDMAIVGLDGPIDDGGLPPTLYGGRREQGQVIVMVGFGGRGIGSAGEDSIYDGLPGKAAAENIVAEVMDALEPPPRDADAGNWLAVTLRREDEGAGRLDGILGSGDSGGSAWLLTGGLWAITGVNANGTGDTYGSQSFFARVSGAQDWLNSVVPGLTFVS
jgi:hypothetical protein